MSSKKKTKKSTKAGKATRSRNAGSKARAERSPMVSEIIFLVILVLAVFVALSLFGLCGIVGKTVSALLFGLFGAVAYIFPVLMIVAAGLVISNTETPMYRRKALYGLGLFLTVCGIVQWFFNSDVKNVWETYTYSAENHSRGGFFGGLLSFELGKLLGSVGDLIFLIGLLLLFFILFSRKLIFTSMKRGIDKKRAERATESAYIYDDVERERMSVPTINGGMRAEAEAHATGKGKTAAKKNGKRQEIAPKLSSNDVGEKPAKKLGRRKKEMRETAVMEPVEPALPETEEERQLKNIHITGLSKEDKPESNIFEKELEEKFGKKGSADGDKAVSSEASVDKDSMSFSAGELKDLTAAGVADVLDGGKAEKADGSVVSSAANKFDEEKSPADEIASEIDAVREIPYEFPSLDLLSKPKSGAKTMSEKELKETALKLQETLESFGVGVQLGDISVGPSVTRYELIPEQGVKVSRITSLSDDIKLSLAASDIRIEAPIPGKSAVGIEVPNKSRVTITLRELLESEEFSKAKSKVTFAVGKDISGKTVVTDIAKMPHLLVAGSTGSGKSVLINTLIMSIIYKANPNEVKLIMVDPKMVEFMAYAEIPHLMIPVVEDPKKASAALAWAVAEMEKRYKKFSELRIRDIASYNAKVAKMKNNTDPEFQKMPQIVIIVDEFADLMMVASHDVEDSVCRLAQKARAAGIHLVLATQRPSVNVITGLIKANIPSRIALSVSSQIDSRTIIDSAGAEKLLGNGDMLFAPQTIPEPIRVQGAFVSDDDRDKVVNFLKESSGPAYDASVTETIETVQTQAETGAAADTPAAGGGNDRDEYFEEAGKFIIEKEKASIGNLQRVFRIGFNRAARIMDQLADAGVVGPEEGTKARQILMTMEQFEAFLAGGSSDGVEQAE